MFSKDISELIKKLVKESGATLHLDKYGQYLLELSNLSELLNTYTTLTADGLPKLKEEDYNRLKQAYNRAIKAGRFYTDAINADANRQKADVNRAKLVSEFDNLLTKDFSVLSNSLSTNNKTFIDVLRESRGVTLSVSGNDISIAGAQASERIPITYTDANGDKLTGFFTETKYLDTNKSVRKLLDTMTEGHPEYAVIMNELMDGPKFELTFGNGPKAEEDLEAHIDNGRTITDNIKIFIDDLVEYKVDRLRNGNEIRKLTDKYEKIKEQITGDQEFAYRFYNFVRGYSQAHTFKMLYAEYPMIDQGSNLGDRNVAMSQVASALGIPDVIAKSVKMKLVVDGVEKDGSFMAFAKGSDIKSMKDDDPLTRLNLNGIDNPEAFKSIADLQVLDYICGNVDRHSANIFYLTKETPEGVKLTGVVGIDNDLSFGKNTDSRTNNLRMVGTDNMLVISKDQADKIEAMTKDMLEIQLKGLELSKDEINAAWSRVQNLKNAIIRGKSYFAKHKDKVVKPGYIKVVDDHEWANYSIKDLAKGGENGDYSQENYFNAIKELPETVESEMIDRVADKRRREYLMEISPKIVPEKAPFKIALAKEVRETNEAGLAITRKKLQEFNERRRKVNTGAFIGSKEFDELMDQFKQVKLVADLLPANAKTIVVDKLVDEYKKLREKINIYIDKKEKQRAKKGRLGERSLERLEFAKDLLAFTDTKMKNIKEEAVLASEDLKSHLRENAKDWDEMVAGQPYSEELKELVAKAVVKYNFEKNPGAMDKLSINDFNNNVKAVMQSDTFKNHLREGEFIDIPTIEKKCLEEQRASKQKTNTRTMDAPQTGAPH